MNTISRQILDTAKAVIRAVKSVVNAKQGPALPSEGGSASGGRAMGKGLTLGAFSTDAQNLSRQFLDTAKVIVLAAILVLGMQYVFAWTGPTAPPTGGNPEPPVNVGNNPQVKLGELGVNKLTAGYIESIASGFTNTFAGPISAAAISGSSLSAGSGAITGGSLNVGTGVVTGGQGTFSGGVKVGDDDRNTIHYFQIDTYSGSEGCTQESDLGKMFFRPNNHTIFVCDYSTPPDVHWQGLILVPPPA
ncbi:MAG: hypothetical protein HYT29_01140 [Parcubacteria group bacterium]|nr:hypothetical protein [Parcubacteria group bacterium]